MSPPHLQLLTAAALLAVLACGLGAEAPDDVPSLLLSLARRDVAAAAALQQGLAAAAHPATLHRHVRAVARAAAAQQPVVVLAGLLDCEGSLARWADGVKGLEKWALQMLDASSKLVTGVLFYNVADLGNFDECVQAADVNAVGFEGRYTLPFLEVLTAAGAGANMSAEYSVALSVRLALCVPSLCHAPLLEAVVNDALADVNERLGAALHLRIRLPEEATALAGPWRTPDAIDVLVIMVCVLLATLVIVGTTLDLNLEPDAPLRRSAFLLLAFSAWTNGRRLLTVAPPSDTNFTCISGIRFLSALWVVLGHRYIALLQVPFMNLGTVSKIIKEWPYMIIINAPLSVDTFFLIGGLVNCYAFMRSSRDGKPFGLVAFYVHRYVRLTPAFALMVGITATWVGLVATGPLWYQVVGDEAAYCRRHWWSALLYVANYVNPDEQCMPQSWYLMVDMQLHWVSPLLLYPLARWPRLGLAWLGLVLAGTCAVPFALTYVHHLPSPFATELTVGAQQLFMRSMYYPTHTRGTAYVFGILAGYLLFLAQEGRIRRRLSSNQVVLGWLLSGAIAAIVVFSAKPVMEAHVSNVLASAFHAGLYRLGWSVAMAWVVLACILGRGGPINAFLSWTPFAVLGRLTYGVYLTHAAVQLVDHGSIRASKFFLDFKMVEHMFSDAAIAIILGGCLSLALESPISAIEKSLRARSKEAAEVLHGKGDKGHGSKV